VLDVRRLARRVELALQNPVLPEPVKIPALEQCAGMWAAAVHFFFCEHFMMGILFINAAYTSQDNLPFHRLNICSHLRGQI
jgi:hypothetical protein